MASDDQGRIDIVTKAFQVLADTELRGYSPLYEAIARSLLADPVRLAAVAALPADPGRVPITLFAAVHELTLREPDLPLAEVYRSGAGDPWPAFADVLDTRADELARTMAAHHIQTNEVGRSAVLLPAVTQVASTFPGRALALVELGPSAGLNLRFDRYAVTYSDGRTAGDADSAVQLACAVVGDRTPPLPDAPLPVASRVGLDRAPVDVTDPDACRWLEACVWPDVPDRLTRLRAALDLARSEPPALVQGDIVADLPDLLAGLPHDVVPVVLSTWVLAYLDRAGRQAVHDLVVTVGGTRPVALVTAEYPQVTPWIPEPTRPPAVEEGRGASLLGLLRADPTDGVDAVPLAWMHAHGQWLDWVAPT